MAEALERPGFLDRSRERDVLDRLVAGVRAGESRVLVLRGEAGIGKTSLLEYLSAAAEGCRIARAAGAETCASTFPTARPSSATIATARRSRSRLDAPFQRGSESGKWRPMSPRHAAPRIASVTA